MTSPADEELFADLRRRLARSVRRVCPVWLASHAEDIVQTAMIRILDASRKRGEGNPDLSSLYLEKAVFSATVDEIRRRRRRREQAMDEASLPETGDSSPPDPQAAAESREIAEGIHDCLGRLPAARMTPVTLSLQGHSVPEIARLLRSTAKVAENQVYRGLAALRRCLAEKGLAR
ncbi:MAG: sigma-70 family RNA polymerase sigma factor [Acidobacteria bacterium]|nr:sigma-70 family RNA polymerase sigma factor [Acidobacteriota bacterium]